mgnify:FL=1|tara:strand:+ start:682 stop:870 length:189 start_codon:yes stop_codon:yes gene_type:complete
MKKEWMYFIAGAGLAVAIMSATILIQGDNYSDFDECLIKEAQKLQVDNISALVGYCMRYRNV